MRMLVTPDTDFSNISWNWLCYQRAFSAIYQIYFWKLTYLLKPFYYRYDWKVICRVWYELLEIQMKYYTSFRVQSVVQSSALGVCFSICWQHNSEMSHCNISGLAKSRKNNCLKIKWTLNFTSCLFKMFTKR